MEGIRPLESVKFHCNIDNNILEKGKFLFLAPTSGIGTGSGAIVVGDGKRECKDLPYFIDGTTTDKFNRLLYILFKNNLISNDDLNYIIGL